MAMGIVLLSALLTPVLAYYRTAIAVDGTVVKGAGNLTLGGKIGTYTVLLQVLNPPAGELDLLLECCGEAQALAGEASVAINSNTAGPTDNVRSNYKGEGMCSEPGLGELLKQGNPECTYLYSFKDKDWAKYSHTAVCVPEDVCAVNVAGATDGRALTYAVVLQILNPSAGNLVYAGKGGIGACQEGMNQVNAANLSYFNKEEEKTADVFGVKIPLGKKSTVELPGMKMMGPIELLGKCEDQSNTGVLYVFDNKFWDKTYHSMNVTGYYKKQDIARQQKEIDELLNYGKPEKSEPETSKPKLKAFDLAAALSDVAKGLKAKLEDSKNKDSAEAQKAVINQAEKKETKKVASQESEEQEATEDDEPYGYVPEAQKAVIHHKVTEDDEPYGYVPEAPEVPKAPPAPEAPKAPPAPEAPKAPPAPKVTEDDEPYGYVPEAPEVPKAPPAPEAPKAPPAPEAPKAPPAPKVPEPKVVEPEVPEAPKAPPAPALPKEKAAPEEETSRRLKAMLI